MNDLPAIRRLKRGDELPPGVIKLVKVYVSLATFRGESRFSTWLMRIAYPQYGNGSSNDPKA